MGFRRRSAPDVVVEAQKPAPKAKVATKTGTTSKFNKVGAIVEKKDGSFYLKFDEKFDVSQLTLNGVPVTNFQVEDPTAKFDRMVAANKMTDAEADAAAAAVPAYVLFEVQIITE